MSMQRMAAARRWAAVLSVAIGSIVATAAPAEAAGEAVTAPETAYIGNNATFTFTAGAETGPYTADLMSGTTLVARIASGTQIDDLGAADATASIVWGVPTAMKLEGTGYTLSIKAGATTLTSGAFAIAAPSLTGGEVAGTFQPLGAVNVSWSSTGLVGNRIAIDLVSADGKTKLGLTKATDNDGSESLVLPAKTTVGSWHVALTPEYKHAKGVKGPAFSVAAAAPTLLMMQSPWYAPVADPAVLALGSHGHIQLLDPPGGSDAVLGLYDSTGTTKLLDLGTLYAHNGNMELTFAGAKLGAKGPGSYLIKATFPKFKGSTVTASVTLTAQPAPTITAPALAGVVTHGQEVPIALEYRTTGDTPVTDRAKTALVSIVAVNGSTKVPLVAKRQIEYGKATYAWTVGPKLTPGSGWKIQILDDNAAKAVLAETGTFTIRANPTRLAKDIAASAPSAEVPEATAPLAVASTLYTGDTASLTFTAGAETGPYTVDLKSGTKLVARIDSGTQIDDLGAADATATVKWTIPTTMKLEGTGYTAVITAGATTITSDPFAIATSTITGVDPSDPAVPGLGFSVGWSSLGATGDLVAIDLVDAAGKVTKLVKQTSNTGSAFADVGIKTAPGDYTVIVRPIGKSAKSSSAPTTVVAAMTPSITLQPLVGNANPSTAPIGGIYNLSVILPVGDTADIALVVPSTGKALITFAKGVSWFGQRIVLLDSKLTQAGPGAYELRVTSKGIKTQVTKYPITILAGGAQFTSGTLSAVADGVTHGTVVPLVWATGAIDLDVSLQVTNGSKTIVLEKAEFVREGAGAWDWLVSDKVPAGSGWKLQLIDRLAKKGSAPLHESAAFTVSVNPTTLAKNLPS